MVTAIAGGRSGVYAATCNGIYRSDDGAASWHGSGLQRACVVRLAVDPSGDADTLYAIVDNQLAVSFYPEPSGMVFIGTVPFSTLWVSRDGGLTWSNREVSSGHALAIDPTQPGTAYIANLDSTYGPLAVTHDSGTTWRTVPDAPGRIFHRLAVDSRDGVLYAASGFLSILSGGSWSELAIPVTSVALGAGMVYAAGSGTFCRKPDGASWTCNALPGISPSDILEVPPQTQGQVPRLLLLSYDGLFSSVDGGANFVPVSGDPKGFASAAAIDPFGAAVYVGNDVGVYRSADRGATWAKSSVGLNSSWIRALTVDPKDPSTIWAGGEARIHDVSQAGPGVFRSSDGGASWVSASASGRPGYVFSLGIDPSNSRNLFAASFGKVDRSADGGSTWTETGTVAFQNSGFVHAIAVDPSSSSKVLAASNGLKSSDDGGENWSGVLPEQVYSLLFDSRHPGTVYAGEAWETSYYPFGTGFAVQTSRDDGRTWRRAGSMGDGAVTAFAEDPFSDEVVYAATYAGTILRSADSGATWEHWDTDGATSGSPIFTLVADPVRPGLLYLGSWAGAYISLDGGRNWDLFVEGLEPYGVLGLAISPDGRFLYAGTTGAGVFRRDLVLSERAPVNPLSGGTRTPRKLIRR
jgi:photosystem II stability/assembly factor-like uncharacterized protein